MSEAEMRSLRLQYLAAIACVLTAPVGAQEVSLSSGSVVEIIASLRPGQYVWAPEIAPDGPMLMVVNLKTQRAVFYRNGVPIGATTISTGRVGRETPTGVFTILQKQVVHHSSKYDNAPMPFMERLTWAGVALHAGHLPGYPASHGCIRLPEGFAKLLYGETGLGMTVVIANVPSVPRVAPTPNLLAADGPGLDAKSTYFWDPKKSEHGPVSVIVSAADRRALVLRNGSVIGSAPVTIEGRVAGTWAYALRSIDKDGQHWVRFQMSDKSSVGEQIDRSEWQRFSAPEAFKRGVAAIISPGTTVVVTPDSLSSAAAPVTVIESGS